MARLSHSWAQARPGQMGPDQENKGLFYHSLAGPSLPPSSLLAPCPRKVRSKEFWASGRGSRSWHTQCGGDTHMEGRDHQPG